MRSRSVWVFKVDGVSSGSAAVTRTSLYEWCCNLSGHVAIEPGGTQKSSFNVPGPRFMVWCSVPAGMWTTSP